MDRLLRESNPPTGQLASPKPQYKDVQTNNWEELKGEGGASYVKDKDVFAKLEQARALLDAISGKDFATQTTLAAVLAKLTNLESELATIKANQLSGDQKVQLSGNIALQYKYSIIPNTGARHYFGVSGVKLLHNGPMTFWLKNNFDLGTRNNVQLHWYTGGNQIIPPTTLPNIPVGATLGVVVGGYPIRAEDTSELIWVPNPGAHLVRISWDIRSDATGGMEALCTITPQRRLISVKIIVCRGITTDVETLQRLLEDTDDVKAKLQDYGYPPEFADRVVSEKLLESVTQ